MASPIAAWHKPLTMSPATASLWAITACFNPQGWARRRANYRVFRRHLGVPLLTVELGYGGRFASVPG